MTDYKALCARMADELDHYRQLLMDDRRETHALATEARAALAQPEPPVAGEVAAALIELRSTVMALDQLKMYVAAQRVKRAADLLQHQHPQPVAVSERLPVPEDCDAEGRCWWLKDRANPEHDLLLPTWHLQRQGPAGSSFFRFTHWLPAHALPAP
jgi:hypothetical protein